MQFTPSVKDRERQILKKVVNKSTPKNGLGGKIGPFDPYMKTMVPVPPYITTGSPTPSDNTTINYSRRESGDKKAKSALSNIKQFDRKPTEKDRTNKLVGFINDEKQLKKSNK
jgi:hypothetical protein